MEKNKLHRLEILISFLTFVAMVWIGYVQNSINNKLYELNRFQQEYDLKPNISVGKFSAGSIAIYNNGNRGIRILGYRVQREDNKNIKKECVDDYNQELKPFDYITPKSEVIMDITNDTQPMTKTVKVSIFTENSLPDKYISDFIININGKNTDQSNTRLDKNSIFNGEFCI